VNWFKYNGKAKLIKWAEKFSAVTDCLEICKIPAIRLTVSIENIAEILSAITWIEFLGKELLNIGERIVNLERLYNQRLGLDRKDEWLLGRFRNEPVPEGNSKGEIIDENCMLEEYYSLKGWNKKGLPIENKLKDLKIII